MFKTFCRTILALGALLIAVPAHAQEPTPPRPAGGPPATISVFLDCNFCESDHVRTEIPYVDWVRDRTVADVHILATSQGTGSGGYEYTFTFIGLRRFDRMVDTIVSQFPPTSTSPERRTGYTRTIKVGLVPFLARTPMAERMNVTVTMPTGAAAAAQTSPKNDPWHGWVFSVSASGYSNGEKSYSFTNAFYDGSGQRITEKWKTVFGGNYSYDDSKSTVENGNAAGNADTTYVTIKRNWRSYASQFYGFNQHWSAGLTGALGSNSYQNQNRYARAKAALEYNLFPYRESTRRQLRAQLGVGMAHYQYIDTTVYLKTEETVPIQFAGVALSARQPWGNISANISRNSLLLEPSKRSTIMYGNANLRIVKGLSLFFSGEYDWIHDQLFLRKGTASTTNVLLRQQQLATSYFYYGNIGLSYTFGSIFNNVVFPRFNGSSTF